MSWEDANEITRTSDPAGWRGRIRGIRAGKWRSEMLWNPKFDVPTKADPLSLETLIAWLEKQPADERYDFCEWNQCLLGQWLRTIDPLARRHEGGDTGFIYCVFGQPVDLEKFAEITHAGWASLRHLHTFGLALSRARSLLTQKAART